MSQETKGNGQTRPRAIGDEVRTVVPYIENVPVDNLYTISIQLASALWATRERLEAIEALLIEKSVLSRQEIETFRVPQEAETGRQADRNKFIVDIFRVLRDNPG